MAISNRKGAIAAGIATGVTAKVTTRLATDATLPANAYDNGVSGVGATITADVNGVLADIDGVTPVVGDRILVKDEVAGLKNGFYDVTSVGSAGTKWILTRSVDADENAEVGVNTNAFVSEGTNADTLFNLTTDGTIDIGTTALTFESLIAAFDTLEEILANGNTSGPNDISVDVNQKIFVDTLVEKTLNAGVTIDGLVAKDSALIFDSSTNSKILDDSNTTSSMFFGHFLSANVLADYTISPDDGSFGATSGGEIYGSKGDFDEISLYLNGGAAISAFNFGGGSDGGIQINSSVTTIINPARASIGYSLISMSGNLSAATNAGEIVLGDASTVNVVSDATDRQASIIGSKSSTYNTGVVNSVILGGDGLVASIDNTVYVQDIIMGASSKLLATGIFERDLDAGVVVESVIMIDGNTRFLTGGAIQTEKVAGNTALIQAFDVDGATYVTFATLTANNTPTMDLSPNVTMGGGQIALLPGRSGGQTLNGGTATGENLTLVSTAHATKGKILFGTSGYDEVNNRLGIGTTTPSEILEVSGNIKCDTVFSASENIFSVSDTIFSAAILTLNGTPVTIVSAPGAGKVIEVISVTIRMLFGTTAYATNTALRVITATAQDEQVRESRSLLSTVSRITRGTVVGSGPGATDLQLVDNQALIIDAETGNPTAGDGDIIYYVTYRIITL